MLFTGICRYLVVFFIILYSHWLLGSNESLENYGITILTSVDGSLSNSVENNTSDYSVKSDYDGVKYRFDCGSKCVGLIYNNQMFWSHKASEYSNKFPSLLYLNTLNNNITLFFVDDSYYTYVFDSDKYKFDSSKISLTPSECPQEIQLFDADGTNEMATNKYKVVSYFKHGEPKQVLYYLNDECGKITCEGEEVWKHDLTSNYPKTMTYLKDQMILEFNDGYEVYKKSESGWNLSSCNREFDEFDDDSRLTLDTMYGVREGYKYQILYNNEDESETSEYLLAKKISFVILICLIVSIIMIGVIEWSLLH